MIEFEGVDLHATRSQLLGARTLFSISELFHENSKIMSCAPGISLSAESIVVGPNGFKRYAHAAQLNLPLPKRSEDVFAVIRGRRSCREYSKAPLSIDILSVLAFHALGISVENRRCIPSAGGLCPLELYVLAIRFCTNYGCPRFGASLFFRLTWDTAEFGEIQIYAVIDLADRIADCNFGCLTINGDDLAVDRRLVRQIFEFITN